MDTDTVRKMPTRLRLVECAKPLSHFVNLDERATGYFGWLQQAEALLISGGEKKGDILFAAFAGRPPLGFPGQSVNVPDQMSPEMVIAAAALRRGISLRGCGLYKGPVLSLSSSLFFSRAGVTSFYYSQMRATPDPKAIFQLQNNGIYIIHVDLR